MVLEVGNVDSVAPGGGITGEDVTSIRPTGCGEEMPLSLDLPPLDGPPPATLPGTTDPTPATTPPETSPGASPEDPTTKLAGAAEPAAPGTVDVVLDTTDLPNASEPITWTWTVHLGDTEVGVATGAVVGDDADGYPWPQVALVADDLAVPDGTEFVGLMISGGDVANLCIGGPPPADDPTARVLVVRIAERACTPEWVAAVPRLTVPPEWSLRQPPATECVDLPPTALWGQCLADAAMSGTGVAEWSTGEAGVLTTYRVDAGALAIVRRAISPDSIDWTSQDCTGVDVADGGHAVTPTGCGPEESLGLQT